MSNRRRTPQDAAEQAPLFNIGSAPEATAFNNESRELCVLALRDALNNRSQRSVAIAERGLKTWATDPELLLLGR